MLQFLKKHSFILSLVLCLSWMGVFVQMTGWVGTSRSA